MAQFFEKILQIPVVDVDFVNGIGLYGIFVVKMKFKNNTELSKVIFRAIKHAYNPGIVYANVRKELVSALGYGSGFSLTCTSGGQMEIGKNRIKIIKASDYQKYDATAAVGLLPKLFEGKPVIVMEYP